MGAAPAARAAGLAGRIVQARDAEARQVGHGSHG